MQDIVYCKLLVTIFLRQKIQFFGMWGLKMSQVEICIFQRKSVKVMSQKYIS